MPPVARFAPGIAALIAARQIHPELHGSDQQPLPTLAENPAAVGGADDHGLYPGGSGLIERHVGEPEIGVAAG